MSTAEHPGGADPVETTVVPIILAVALGHLLNDLMQSLIPAIYPILKTDLALTFGQIGLITLVFQGTASILQPLVGLWTDRRPLPYALAAGMASTGAGLVLLAHGESFETVLAAVALIGLGSSIFHPESTRIARLAAGARPGFAQSVFQLGGNIGTALGPLAAALIVLPNGQSSIEWFAGCALLGMSVLALVGRWFVAVGAVRLSARRSRAAQAAPLPRGQILAALAVLIALMFSKFVYTASYSSYFTFFLIERHGVSVGAAQLYLFVFLAAVALGTILGGPIGDRVGRKMVIWVSILGVLPLSLAVPHLPLIPAVAVASIAGMAMASAFPAIIVYAQELLPLRVGMVGGLFFGLAFGMGAVGAAALGQLADRIGIVAVYTWCAWLPAIGLVAGFLPNLRGR
jgi:FSR family fosmidomycin resistance protein-like MFS transporter